jgi:hypothetical protein
MLGYDIKEEAHPELKRILLFYEHENQAYWKQQSPYYYTNYETCNWRRIVRSKHFINFYKEFIKKGMNHNEFLAYKRKEFFAQEGHRVISRNDKPWNHRELIILYDLLSENGIWDEENEHKNVALWNNLDSDSSNDIFKAQSTIWKAWRYYDKENQVTLLHNWRDILTNEYNVQIIE